jgi:NAD(P)H dehydrogenase (quinone)
MNVLIVYYSMYGHIYKMAEAVAEGVKQVKRSRSENVSCAGNFAR